MSGGTGSYTNGDGEDVTYRVEYGRRVDCTKNGCEIPHGDDGEVYPGDYDKPTINGHAITFVERTVTTTDWRPRAATEGNKNPDACPSCGTTAEVYRRSPNHPQRCGDGWHDL